MNQFKIDLTGKPLGRAASEVAKIIIGKDNVDYAPNKVSSNQVIASNVEKLSISGRKPTQKKYYSHSGYIGRLKEKEMGELFKMDPKKFFTNTVKGMLPKNKLAQQMIKQLKYE